jgi:regulator of protease activity HflC (stomatin/prohibitin superfamily)
MENINASTWILLSLIVFLVILLINGLKIVPQSKVYVIERLGSYHRTLAAGLNFIVPFIDKIKYRVDISEHQMNLKDQLVTTQDNVVILIDVAAFYRIKDAARFHYRVEDGKSAIRATIDGTLRALIGRRTLDQVNADRLQIASDLASEVREAAEEWGVHLGRVEIVNLEVKDQTVREKLSDQADAERERRATVLKAEGEAQKKRLEADADLYKEQKKAEGIRILAEAEAYAINTRAAAIEKPGGILALEGEIRLNQLKSLEKTLQGLGTSDNTKWVIFPQDLVQAAGKFAKILEK